MFETPCSWVQSAGLTLHVLAQAAAPVAADALRDVPIFLRWNQVPAHQVKTGDHGLVHDGDALLHLALLAAAEQS